MSEFMTGKDFWTAGVTIEHSIVDGRHTWSISGPDDPALMAKLRAEVARRVEAFRACPVGSRAHVGGPWVVGRKGGQCDRCGDPRPPYTGGDCKLCCLALHKLATDAGPNPVPVRLT